MAHQHQQLIGEGLYVYDIACNCEADSPVVAVSASNHSVHIFSSGIENEIAVFSPHKKKINSIEFSHTNAHILCTASQDRTVGIWDIRQVTSAIASYSYNDEVIAVTSSLNDTLIAAAIGSSIVFHDMRKMGGPPLASYEDCHTDLITNLKFSKMHPAILASGGEDGLACIFNTAESSDKQAVTSILNVDCPIRSLGYFGRGDEGLYCLTSSETASFWHHSSAQRIGNFTTVRTDLDVDYLVSCFFSPDEEELFLLGGKYTGEAILAGVTPESIIRIGSLDNGHNDVIRSSVYYAGASGRKLITAGEDGRICLFDVSSIIEMQKTDTTSKKKRKVEY